MWVSGKYFRRIEREHNEFSNKIEELQKQIRRLSPVKKFTVIDVFGTRHTIEATHHEEWGHHFYRGSELIATFKDVQAVLVELS